MKITKKKIIIEKCAYFRIPYGRELRYEKEMKEILENYPSCPDCGVEQGELHLLDTKDIEKLNKFIKTKGCGEWNLCDMEECPKCHDQLLNQCQCVKKAIGLDSF